MPFSKGHSGNPKGKPRGTKDKRTELRELLRPHAPELVSKVVEKALEGDISAIKICLDRLIPQVKQKDEHLCLQSLQGNLTEQGDQIVAAMGTGKITPTEANAALQALTIQSRLTVMDDLERRVVALETKS